MNPTNDRTLHFSLGPVQDFVAQSRRTRDLWSSSYLVSYLAGCAMDAAQAAGGEIVRPHVEGDALLKAIRAVRARKAGEEKDVDPIPETGTLPNHFRATAEDPADVGRAAERGIRAAWTEISDAVWRILSPAVENHEHERVQEIWDRQIAGFWQVQWAVGGPDALLRRKNWRGGWLAAEPGDKCTLMTGWQELSGYYRSTESKLQDGFWSRVRRALGGYDLREDERLCAVALVKRLFPTVAADTIGWPIDAKSWPSTSYLAARPWVEDVLAHGGEETIERADRYARSVVRLAIPSQQDEGGSRRLRLAELAVAGHRFLNLAGSFFFEENLRIEKRTPLRSDEAESSPVENPDRVSLERELNAVAEAAAAAGRDSAPSPFYGLLLLDGDRLGEVFATHSDPKSVSEALGRFAVKAVEVVQSDGGMTLYAGGDDLLAFLPLPSALATSIRLARLYERVMRDESAETYPTASAVLTYAHCRAPLRAVVADAHRFLDDEVKDANGRASLGITVRKTSGATVRWVGTWRHLVPDWEGNTEASRIAAIVQDLAAGDVSSSFLMGQRMVFGRLAGTEGWHPGIRFELPTGIEPEVLVRAELARARDEDPDAVAEAAQRLAAAMAPSSREAGGEQRVDEGQVTFDALLLARFLGQHSPMKA